LSLETAKALGVILLRISEEAQQGLLGQGVAEMEGDELEQTRGVEMGNVTTGVPTLWIVVIGHDSLTLR
jgi:hypothetical protein